MTRENKFTAEVNLDDFASDIARIDEVSDRARLAGYGLADPLVKAREGQMQREIERTARRKGADHPDVARQQANYERGAARFELFAEERERVRVSRPSYDVQNSSSVWGRVVDDGVPQTDMTVSAYADGQRLAFACTDAVGGFALELPGDIDVTLSVRSKEGAELFRDSEPAALKLGQSVFREIDLTRGADAACPDPGDGPDVPDDETVTMIDLVGRGEATALKLLTNLGLTAGARDTVADPDNIGLILSHVPEAGAQVTKGDAVDYSVGVSDQILVPDVIGLTLDQAAEALDGLGLVRGALIEVEVTNERGGLIVEQIPQAGSLVDNGTAVELSIGVASEAPPDLIEVPDVIGITRDEAQQVLKTANLREGTITDIPVAGEKVGLVLTQSPGAGAMVTPKAQIALGIGVEADDPSDDITVPDLSRLSRDGAHEVLKANGLQLGAVSTRAAPDAFNKLVIEQSPAAGSTAQAEDKVDIVIGTRQSEASLVVVPNVIGDKLEGADITLVEARLAMSVSERPVSAPSQVGIVIAQAPSAGQRVQAGSKVAVVIGVQRDGPGSLTFDPAVADLLRRVGPETSTEAELTERFTAAGITKVDDVKSLLEADRREVRDKLGLRTLRDTDKLISALRRALRDNG